MIVQEILGLSLASHLMKQHGEGEGEEEGQREGEGEGRKGRSGQRMKEIK